MRSAPSCSSEARGRCGSLASGEEFALRVRDILRSVDELEDLARASRDQLVGRLRIGVIPTIAPYLLPTIIGNLTGAYAGLDIHVRETLTPRLIQELGEGRLDTAIVALPVSEPSFTEVALFSESFRPGAARRRRGKTGSQPRDRCARCGSCCWRRATASAIRPCPSATCMRRARANCSTEVRCPRWCRWSASGIGVTLIPEMAVAVETRSAPVSVAQFKPPRPSRTIGMIWRKTSPLARQLLQMSEIVRQSAEDMRLRHAAAAVTPDSLSPAVGI